MNLFTLLAVGLPILSGPDARLQVSFGDDGGRLSYSVAYDGKTLVGVKGRLGLEIRD